MEATRVAAKQEELDEDLRERVKQVREWVLAEQALSTRSNSRRM